MGELVCCPGYKACSQAVCGDLPNLHFCQHYICIYYYFYSIQSLTVDHTLRTVLSASLPVESMQYPCGVGSLSPTLWLGSLGLRSCTINRKALIQTQYHLIPEPVSVTAMIFFLPFSAPYMLPWLWFWQFSVSLESTSCWWMCLHGVASACYSSPSFTACDWRPCQQLCGQWANRCLRWM